MSRFHFEELPLEEFPLWKSPKLKEKLLQWNLDKTSTVKRYRISQYFYPENEEQFFHDFADSLEALGVNLSDKKYYKPLKITVISMNFFDKLEKQGIVTPSGHICRCMDEIVDGVVISDLLRDMLANPDSENADLFSGEEKNELIFKIMERVVIGGSICQPDEKLSEYLENIKEIYRSLVNVVRETNTKKVKISSMAYEVNYSPEMSRYSKCFIVLEPKKWLVTVWNAPFVSHW